MQSHSRNRIWSYFGRPLVQAVPLYQEEMGTFECQTGF